jgi:hypothetical protein
MRGRGVGGPSTSQIVGFVRVGLREMRVWGSSPGVMRLMMAGKDCQLPSHG